MRGVRRTYGSCIKRCQKWQVVWSILGGRAACPPRGANAKFAKAGARGALHPRELLHIMDAPRDKSAIQCEAANLLPLVVAVAAHFASAFCRSTRIGAWASASVVLAATGMPTER